MQAAVYFIGWYLIGLAVAMIINHFKKRK